MTPLRLVLAGAAGSAAADFGDQDPRGADPYGHRQPGRTREQARPLEQFVTVGLRTARLFPSSPVTRRRFWGSGRSRSRVSAERGRRPGRFRRRSPPPCFPRSGGRGRGTGGRARAPCGGNCSPAIRAKIRPEPVREPLSPPGGLSRPEPGSERVGQEGPVFSRMGLGSTLSQATSRLQTRLAVSGLTVAGPGHASLGAYQRLDGAVVSQ